MTSRERVLAMLDGRPVDRLPAMPITMMFAARYSGVPYREYATRAERLAPAQLRVATDFEIDHLNVMSDPACEAADCGAAVVYGPDQPPALDESNALLQEKATLAQLKVPDPTDGRMGNRLRILEHYRAVRHDKLVEGWIEGPCAEAADLRGINTLMMDFYDDPDFVRELFAFCNRMELAFAKEQIARGAELMGIGDAAASLVGPEIYREFVWPFEKELVHGLHRLGARVRLHICGNITPLLADIGRLECELVDLDFMVPVAEARRVMGERQVLLGNMDPVRVLQNGTPAEVRAVVAECHRQAGPRYVIGAGCEVPRDTPAENFRALIHYAQEAAC